MKFKTSKRPSPKNPKSLASLKKLGGVPEPLKVKLYKRPGTESFPSLCA